MAQAGPKSGDIADDQVIVSPIKTAPTVAAQDTGDAGVSPATRSELNSVVTSGRSAAAEIRQLGAMAKPGSDATEAEKTRYQIRIQNAQTAKRYEDYLNTLSRSMGGTSSEGEARQSLAKANQTLGYLTTLLRGSRLAAGR